MLCSSRTQCASATALSSLRGANFMGNQQGRVIGTAVGGVVVGWAAAKLAGGGGAKAGETPTTAAPSSAAPSSAPAPSGADEVSAWLKNLSRTIDTPHCAGLFLEESWWRDLLAFTWNIGTPHRRSLGRRRSAAASVCVDGRGGTR